jgi:signal transduction histidine kinase
VALVATRLLDRVAGRVVWLGNPDGAVRDLAERLGRAGDPTAVPGELETALREGLGLRAVVELGPRAQLSPPPDAASGNQGWPVVYQGRRVGTVVVSPRPGERALTARDRAGLDRLIRSAAGALDAAEAHERLRAAHEQLVATREEERRRLRRELHDDLAPTLAGLSLTAAAAVDLLSTNPARAAVAQREVTDGLSRAAQQVRDIAYDLRPPVLDDRGLLAALQERVVNGTAGPEVRVVGDCSTELPAALGAAALRIVQEAVTNVRRHARARTCEVVVEQRPDALHVRVTDDGCGFPPTTPRGVGLVAMRERAEEVGGSLDVSSGADGTQVHARLPVHGRPG